MVATKKSDKSSVNNSATKEAEGNNVSRSENTHEKSANNNQYLNKIKKSMRKDSSKWIWGFGGGLILIVIVIAATLIIVGRKPKLTDYAKADRKISLIKKSFNNLHSSSSYLFTNKKSVEILKNDIEAVRDIELQINDLAKERAVTANNTETGRVVKKLKENTKKYREELSRLQNVSESLQPLIKAEQKLDLAGLQTISTNGIRDGVAQAYKDISNAANSIKQNNDDIKSALSSLKKRADEQFKLVSELKIDSDKYISNSTWNKYDFERYVNSVNDQIKDAVDIDKIGSIRNQVDINLQALNQILDSYRRELMINRK